MGLWSKLLRWGRGVDTLSAAPAGDTLAEAPEPAAGNTVDLPAEPFVFECQSCGKVFEARRRHPLCPECDSREVSLLSE
jgi:Zn finger protein HypA/HybF involved in hydrogenase expression